MPSRADDLIQIPASLWERPEVIAALRNRDIGRFFALVQQYSGASQTQIGIACVRAAQETAPEEVAGRPSVHRLVRDLAPATYNTINKWALGISDTYALGVLAETTALDVPVVVLPFVNTALASRPPFRRSVEAHRAEGVRILLDPGGFQPHPPRTGGNLINSYPWHLALDEAEHLVLAHR
jgi:hypothetical protein